MAIISTFSKTLVYPNDPVIPPNTDEFWPGVYFKVGTDKTFDTGNSWFPTYNPANPAHDNSCYGILDNKLWCV